MGGRKLSEIKMWDICFPTHKCSNCPNWELCQYLRDKYFKEWEKHQEKKKKKD